METKTKTISDGAAILMQHGRLTRFFLTLLVLMLTATAWAAKPDKCLDACTGGVELIHIQGWAYDPDASSQSIDVHVYFYTDAGCTNRYGGIHVTKANVSRPDVNQAKGITGNHGFSADIPIAAGKYWVKLFAIDTNGDGNPQIGATTAVTVTGPVTITIGDVTNYSCNLPFKMDKNYSLVQQIYTAEEINLEGTITSISFNYRSTLPFSMSGVQVFLKHTDKNVFENDADMVPVSAEDKVFEGTFSATGKGWVTIEFDTPFEYNGTSNLLVCCFDPTDGSFGTDYQFYFHHTSDNKSHFAYSDNTVPSLEEFNVSGYSFFSRNNIRFNIYPGTFSKPDNLTVSSCTEEEATLTWTAPETINPITGYGYQFKKASDADWSEEVITTGTSVTFSNLTTDTDYAFRVRTIYGSRKSIYQPLPFTTATPLPYEQGFENGMGRWGMVDPYWGHTGINEAAARNGDNGFYFDSYNRAPQYLISPRFAGTNTMSVSFYYRDQRPDTGHFETFYVGYSTTTNDLDAFTWDSGTSASNVPWTLYENHSFPADTKYIAVKYTSSYTVGLYIDDFSFAEYSTYAKPTTVVVSNLTLTDTEATVSWNTPDGATGYAYQYKKASDAAWSAETTLNTNTVTLSGLTPNTNYNFRVKALYDSNASNFSTTNFQTDGSVVDLPYTDGFENGMGGWRLLECDLSTEIRSNAIAHSGGQCFGFHSVNHHQYLQSPHFAGGAPMKVSFYYNNAVNYPAVFQVGYSSSKEASITWENQVTASSGEWTLYETTVPATTQYVLILCRAEGYMLYLDDFSFTGPIVLADDADNATTISDAASLGEPCNIRLGGRTLYTDGDWNTLTVPFAVDDFTGTPLEGATVMTLSSSAFSNGTLTLNFEDATEIEAGKPYIVKWQDGVNVTIGSAAEWDAFAESVNGGKSFAGKTVMLTSDISGVATMAGTAEHPFRGTFEGAGHTMNMSISDGGEGAAPFHYISGATISNVKTTGTVSGGNHSAGLVGVAQGGTNSIRDCYVDATVSTSGSYVGGILGNGTTSTTTISNCLFGGSIAASKMGILYGWGEDGGTHKVENCVAYGNYGMISTIDLLLGSGTKTVTNCWKNTDAGLQGDNSTFIWTGGPHPLVSGYLGSQWTYDNGFVLSPTVNVVDENIINPVFLSVTVDATPSPVTTAWADFVGTYEPISFSDADKSILFPGTNNTLYYPVSGAYIGAQRAYFRLKGIEAGDLPDPNGPNLARRFVMNFGEGDHTTGIIEIAKDGRESGSSNPVTDWYTLDGRKLQSKPTQKGIYVNNGKKVVIK